MIICKFSTVWKQSVSVWPFKNTVIYTAYSIQVVVIAAFAHSWYKQKVHRYALNKLEIHASKDAIVEKWVKIEGQRHKSR